MKTPDKNGNSVFSFVLLIILLVIGTIMSIQLKNSEILSDGGFTSSERDILASDDSVAYVLDVNDSIDAGILRTKSLPLDSAAILSPAFKSLEAKLLATVNAPEYGGVGIAAPQIGINRRVVAVQRFDKPGSPFEVYPNIQIDTVFGEMVPSVEGCLSVPALRGTVMRYPSVAVSYRSSRDYKLCRDTVSGFSAIVFQHECDHLDGVIYIDKADDIQIDSVWKAEHEAFAAQGKYRRPRQICSRTATL